MLTKEEIAALRKYLTSDFEIEDAQPLASPRPCEPGPGAQINVTPEELDSVYIGEDGNLHYKDRGQEE